MQVASSIFKAYDVRGIVPSTLTEEVAEALGRAFGAIARKEGEQTVAVGRDGRLSGPSLSESCRTPGARPSRFPRQQPARSSAMR